MKEKQIAISQKNEKFIEFSNACRTDEKKATEMKKAFSGVVSKTTDLFGKEIEGLEIGMMIFWIDPSMSICEDMIKLANVVIN